LQTALRANFTVLVIEFDPVPVTLKYFGDALEMGTETSTVPCRNRSS
jgi:hypothetical protein